ncbi:MAG: hypothetical protein A2W82_05410 [Sulfurimonas sp. RIFCSPLOWO2_12_36_12]|uniref:hypothetical protein n=1 Tax=Sulfurimonas sp. RIFCSPLOWO2_12_36_12 TaxID=1802253 RepID=UPI0008D2C169|nr:hypothetical protein [Sulfurimonas sp. RIFCSPLOWO2_12_36_12]OHD99636.1 MAG: hypothetical protein A3J26_07930 [Sulfurimonas sp. RIFCSPLOWO2_02_FULL_36_28]OHE01367.1 MAG: hypothetical protein A2W82_05410 [Sulfurimonas sp. RIFCSPLOWO2_12_36_12]
MTLRELNQAGEKWAYRILVVLFISFAAILPIQHNYIMHKNNRDFTALTPAQKEQYVALESQYWELGRIYDEMANRPRDYHPMGYGEVLSKLSQTNYELVQIERTLPHTSWARQFYILIGAINE